MSWSARTKSFAQKKKMDDEIVVDFNPHQLIIQQQDGVLKADEMGLNYVRQFKNPIGVLMFAGLSQADRMDQLIQLFGSPETQTTPLTQTLTLQRGIIVLGCIDFMSSGKCVLVMDLNEQEYLDGQAHDPLLLPLAACLGSLLVYFHSGKLNSSTLHMLKPLSDVIQDTTLLEAGPPMAMWWICVRSTTWPSGALLPTT